MLIFNNNFGGEFMSEQRKYLLTQKCSLHG